VPKARLKTSEPESWVEAHGDRLFRYALSRIRNERAAEDLVQETLLTAFKSRAKFEGASTELTWMIGILRNKIFEHLRRQSREAPGSLVLDDSRKETELFDEKGHWADGRVPLDWGGEPLRAAETDEFWDALRRCLDGLTPNVARAFVLREMEGVEHHDCAQVLGVPATHLAVLIYRARMRLRRCLERGYFAPEAAG